MNEHELELDLDAIGEQRTRVTTPPVLRARVRTVPLETPPRSVWRRLTQNGGSKSMFSATKLMFAGVVVALFGTFLLVGVVPPSGQQGAPGAEGSTTSSPEPVTDETTTPTAVSGRFGLRDETGTGVPEVSKLSGGGERQVSLWPHVPVDVTDERLNAELVLRETIDEYPGVRYSRTEGRIETPDGAWELEPMSKILGKSGGGDQIDASVWVGEGEYDGLRLIANLDWFGFGFDLEGVIVEAPG